MRSIRAMHLPDAISLVAGAVMALTGLASTVAAQHVRYEPEDWQYIPGTATITAVTESVEGLTFSTFDGLLRVDPYTQRLDHLPEINVGLPSHRLYQVFHDESTDALWVVHDDGISFRLRTDDNWRHVPFRALPDHFRGRAVRRMGGSFEGIWLDMEGVYTLLHSFTGELVHRDIVPPAGPVDWNTSRAMFFEPPDLMGWITTGSWSTSIHEFLGPGFLSTLPTLVYYDRSDHVWYGTELGTLFRGDPYTKRLEPLQAGIAPETVTRMYRDGDRVWFTDNAFRRLGKAPPRNDGYFLSVWDERVSSWSYHTSLESEAIRDAGVNAMLRVGRQLWLATMGGIVLLNTRNGSWGFVGVDAGMRERAVWDLERHDGDVFAATIRGIDRISPATQRVVPADSISQLPRGEVYDLTTHGEVLYAGTAHGVYAYTSKSSGGWRRVSTLPATSLWGDGKDLFLVAGNLVYSRGPGETDFSLYALPLSGEARILEIKGYGSYIWLATSRGAMVYDRKRMQMLTFGVREGLPSDMVYAVEPTAKWVWFLTKGGVVRFNWGEYFE